jgi:hypothetical protein
VTKAAPVTSAGSPLWLVIATAAMAVILLAMSVGETSLSGQYLIDQGEYLSLVGLAFILIAGLYLHRQRRLAASLPLVFPWLLYPVITQGDQIIDHLSITWMRIVVHVLLAAIFAMPVAVIVYAARWKWALPRPVTRNFAIALLVLEMALAYLFLGALMIATLAGMIAVTWWFGSRSRSAADRSPSWRSAVALTILVGGVVGSGALYLGFKNRPGAYQGSPSYFMDPSQPGAGFQSTVVVPVGAIEIDNTSELQHALMLYAASLQKLLDGYYILDRNYNYHFHNELFVRSTPLLPNYRKAGLAVIDEARALQAAADRNAAAATTGDGNPLKALLDDVRGYVRFNFERAETLERMSGEFQATKAGLQHATHIYEGEGKYLGVQLGALLEKHRRAITAPNAAPIVAGFVSACRAIEDKYANRIVGF